MLCHCTVLALFLAAFTGQVIDSRSGEPVPAADIRVQPGDFSAITDSAGRFTITSGLLPSEVTVFVSRIGYAARAFYNVPTTRPAVFALQPITFPMEGTGVTISRVQLPGSLQPSRSLPYTTLEGIETEPRGRQDISASLALTPSVNTQNYGNLTTVSLRGATPEQTLVMLDGMPLNSGLNGLSDITLLPLLPQSRIELVRGGSSAIHGANSVGGVVNLITPSEGNSALRWLLGLGSFGQKHGHLSCQLPARPIGLYLGGSFLHAKNDFPFRDNLDSLRRRQNSDITRWNATAKVMSNRQRRHHYSLLGDFALSRKGTPGPLNWPTDSARQNDTRALGLFEYGWDQTGSSRLTTRLHHQWHWQNYSNPAGYFPANDTHTIATTGLGLSENLTFGNTLGIAAGLQSAYERAFSTAVGKPARLGGAVWSEASWRLRTLTLNPALRWDISSQTCPASPTRRNVSVLSSRLTAIWSPLKQLNASLGANRSFRQPTFNELYWPTSQFTAGNPALKPEYSTEIELGLGGELAGPNRSDWRAGAFFSRLTNLIQWQPGAGDTWRPVNVDTATTAGIETELNLDMTHAGFNYRATYMVCRSKGADLPYRPRLTGNASLWVALPELARLTLTAHGSSRRFSDAAHTDTLAGFLLFNVEASSSPLHRLKGLVLRAGCRNLLDRQYQTVKNYPVPGRTFFAELEVSVFESARKSRR